MLPIINCTVHYDIETPEGNAIKMTVAGLWSRASAWLIDLSIRLVIYIVLAITLSLGGLFGKGVLLICFFILEWFYPVLYEVLNNGMTPGKKIVGIRVVSTNGLHIDWSTSMTRNLIRFIDMLPVIYGVGFISVLVSRYSQRIGDIVAGTIVIYQNKQQLDTSLVNLSSGDNLQPDYHYFITQLNRDERAAFTSFADRIEDLSESRIKELAQIVEPVLQNMNLPVSVESLKSLSLSVADSNETV